MKNELGADAAAVVSAGAIERDAASRVAPNGLAEKNLNNARRLLWEARSDERLFADAVRIFEESARLCGSIEATDRMKAHLLPVEGR